MLRRIYAILEIGTSAVSGEQGRRRVSFTEQISPRRQVILQPLDVALVLVTLLLVSLCEGRDR